MSGWLTREDAQRIARANIEACPGRVKACHVQGTGAGGRVKVTVFVTPLASKDIPEPETFIFAPEDLA